MHIPSFILYFMAFGVPVMLMAEHFSNGRARPRTVKLIVVASLVFAVWMSWGQTPIAVECNPAGAAIYNDC